MIHAAKRHRAALAVAVLLAAFGAVACGGFKPVKTGDYQADARENFRRGVARTEDGAIEDAKLYFKLVREEFPISSYAALARLWTADLFYEQDSAALASGVDAFQQFLRDHPTHPCAGYARFRVAQGYFDRVPSTFWLLPPAAEKDQRNVEFARDALLQFLTTERAMNAPLPDAAEELPKIEHCVARDEAQVAILVRHARRMWDDVVHRLADRELYVAEFYLDRDKPKGTIGRIEALRERFPDAYGRPDVQEMLARAYELDQRPLDARRTWEHIMTKHPDSDEARDAKEAIEAIDAALPGPEAAPAPPANAPELEAPPSEAPVEPAPALPAPPVNPPEADGA